MADKTKYLSLGGGKMYIDRGDGFKELAQVSTVSMSVNLEELEHENTDEAEVSIDKTIITKKDSTLKFTTESISPENLAMAFLGKNSIITQALESAKTVGIVGVKLGYSYPLDVKNISNFSLQKTDATPISTANYEVDLTAGIVTIKDDAPDILEGDTINAIFDVPALTYSAIGAFTEAMVECRLLFVGKAKVGENREMEIYKTNLKMTGDFNLKSKEWNAIEFEAKLLKDETKDFNATGGQFFKTISYKA